MLGAEGLLPTWQKMNGSVQCFLPVILRFSVRFLRRLRKTAGWCPIIRISVFRSRTETTMKAIADQGKKACAISNPRLLSSRASARCAFISTIAAMRMVPSGVITGSHRKGRIPESDIPLVVAQGEEMLCTVNAGDALIMHPLLLHASSKPSVPSRRRVLHFLYGPVVAPPGLQWHEWCPQTSPS